MPHLLMFQVLVLHVFHQTILSPIFNPFSFYNYFQCDFLTCNYWKSFKEKINLVRRSFFLLKSKLDSCQIKDSVWFVSRWCIKLFIGYCYLFRESFLKKLPLENVHKRISDSTSSKCGWVQNSSALYDSKEEQRRIKGKLLQCKKAFFCKNIPKHFWKVIRPKKWPNLWNKCIK